MSDCIEVCSTDELDHGERKIVEVNGISIGVFNVDDEYYALLNTCTHQHGPLCEGRIQQELTAEFDEPGERVKEQWGDDLTVACPWHGWEFDIMTGEHIGDTKTKVPTYDVSVDDGAVYIEP